MRVTHPTHHPTICTIAPSDPPAAPRGVDDDDDVGNDAALINSSLRARAIIKYATATSIYNCGRWLA